MNAFHKHVMLSGIGPTGAEVVRENFPPHPYHKPSLRPLHSLPHPLESPNIQMGFEVRQSLMTLVMLTPQTGFTASQQRISQHLPGPSKFKCHSSEG